MEDRTKTAKQAKQGSHSEGFRPHTDVYFSLLLVVVAMVKRISVQYS